MDRLLADLAGEGGADLVILDIFGSMSKGSETEDTTARPWVNGLRGLVKEGTVLTVARARLGRDGRAGIHTHTWGSFDTRLIVEGDKDKLTAVLSVDRRQGCGQPRQMGVPHGTDLRNAGPDPRRRRGGTGEEGQAFRDERESARALRRSKGRTRRDPPR